MPPAARGEPSSRGSGAHKLLLEVSGRVVSEPRHTSDGRLAFAVTDANPKCHRSPTEESVLPDRDL